MSNLEKRQRGHIRWIVYGAIGIAPLVIGFNTLQSLPSTALYPVCAEAYSTDLSNHPIYSQNIATSMKQPPSEIFQRWGHSFEEDTEDITVYRPSGYEFPPARGRAGIEFRANGEFIDWVIGPTDASQGIRGRWHMEEARRIRINFENNIREPRILEIVECSTDILKVRHQPVSC